MSNVPSQPKVEQIIWFENHIPLWSASPVSFGATAGMVTSVLNATKAARDAYTVAQNAKQATKNAVTGQDEQVRSMLLVGRDLVNVMKAFIANTNNPALWAQAGIEPNTAPGTAAAPTAPFELSAEIDSQGDVLVKWKARQPRGVSGVIYSVRRSIDGADFALLDSVGEKVFSDETVPVGAHMVTYAVKAKRGKQSSDWSAALEIRFGHIGGGGLAIVSTSTQAMKMAA